MAKFVSMRAIKTAADLTTVLHDEILAIGLETEDEIENSTHDRIFTSIRDFYVAVVEKMIRCTSPMPGASPNAVLANTLVPDVDRDTPCSNSATTLDPCRGGPPVRLQQGSDPPSLPTSVKPEVLNKWVEGYCKQEEIVSIFAKGALLDFNGIEGPLTSTDSQSALQYPDAVTEKLQEELTKNRIAGPFTSQPLESLKISPLALREKQDTGKYRLLHNLSFPYNEQSVNYNIPKSSTKVHYESLTDAIVSIQQCTPNVFMAKSDIADAFRIVPLHPTQYHLTGFAWQNYYYFDKCLPQGWASLNLSPRPLSGY